MIKQKIGFIEPTGAPSNVFTKFMTIPLLGPVFLSTIAKNAGYDVQIINENIVHRKVTTSELLEFDILCLSCITATIQRGKEIARQYKQLRMTRGLSARVLIGGIHASMIPQDLGTEFDQIICGEAESIFLKILNGSFKEPLIYGQRNENLDQLPIPDFSLIKGYKNIKVWPVMTSRGCPHQCNFCSVTEMFGNSYRVQSVERIMDEITRYKNGWIFFVDDNFTANKSHSNKLIDTMINYNFNIPWSAQVRVDTAKDVSFVRKMRKAGCGIVFIGLESINPESLQQMKKRQSVCDIETAIRTFQNEGIQVHGMFMLGNDADTKDIFTATNSFIHKNKLSYVQYSVLTPLPGTYVYQDYEKKGRLIHKNWNLYDGLHVVFQPKQMTAVELQHGMINCFRSFYTYTNAIKDCFRFNLSFMRNVARGAPNSFQVYYPLFMKFVGKSILNSWLHKNQMYISYLKNVETQTR